MSKVAADREPRPRSSASDGGFGVAGRRREAADARLLASAVDGRRSGVEEALPAVEGRRRGVEATLPDPRSDGRGRGRAPAVAGRVGGGLRDARPRGPTVDPAGVTTADPPVVAKRSPGARS